MYTVQELKGILRPVFQSYNIDSAILFGSYAKNCATEKSDLDLLVDSHLHGLDFVGFMEDVHEAVQIPVDIFDVRFVKTGGALDNEIKQTGVILFENVRHTCRRKESQKPLVIPALNGE